MDIRIEGQDSTDKIKPKFKIGDLVRFISYTQPIHGGNIDHGTIGRVSELQSAINNSGYAYAVNFPTYTGFWVDESEIEIVDSKSITKKQRFDINKAAYDQFVKLERALNSMRDEALSNADRALTAAHVDYTKALKKRQEAYTIANTARESFLEDAPNFRDRLSLLLDGKYESFAFNIIGKTFSAITGEISIEYNGYKIVFGRYEVMIKDDLQIYIYRIGENKDGLIDHPHVSDGNPCFGTWEVPIHKALYKGDWIELFTLIHKYLSSVSKGDWYMHPLRWVLGDDFCVYCEQTLHNCTCQRCSSCDALIEDCACSRCPANNELMEDVNCDDCDCWDADNDVCQY